jgi:hypothetical protein
VTGIYDDSERNNLLNSDEKRITRMKIKIKFIMFVLKNPKFYQYICFGLKYSEYFFFRIFLDKMEIDI